MNFWIIAAIVVGVILIAGFIINQKESKSASDKAKKLLTSIEKQYNDFVDKRIRYSILKDDNIEPDPASFTEEAMVIIKPDIQSLIALINSTEVDAVSVNYESEIFGNMVAQIEGFFREVKKNSSKKLDGQQEQKLYQGFSDAIHADLAKRLLDLKSGVY